MLRIKHASHLQSIRNWQMEEAGLSGILVSIYQTTLHHIPEDDKF